MSNCPDFNRYQERAEKITEKLNQSRDIDEKVRWARSLLDLEKEIESCEVNDDPKCRLQRKVVIPARRKVAEMVINLLEARAGINNG